jgi:hypothetical protein
VPFYATLGNHELWDGAPERWRDRYGRSNVFFDFAGVGFALLDSGNAGIDPVVYDWLDDWLDAHRDHLAIVATHFPPIDPVGVRSGSFRSRAEATKLLAKLAAARVDLTLYGHIHSYVAFQNAGIPAFISGGGGALPERWDGVGRHFLVVDVDPARDVVTAVRLVPID